MNFKVGCYKWRRERLWTEFWVMQKEKDWNFLFQREREKVVLERLVYIKLPKILPSSPSICFTFSRLILSLSLSLFLVLMWRGSYIDFLFKLRKFETQLNSWDVCWDVSVCVTMQFAYTRVLMSVCVCVCVREREWESASLYVFVSVCVWERESVSLYVCVCVAWDLFLLSAVSVKLTPELKITQMSRVTGRNIPPFIELSHCLKRLNKKEHTGFFKDRN